MLELVFENRAIFQYGALLGLFFAVLRFGASPERTCATIMVAQVAFEIGYHLVVAEQTNISETDLGHFLMSAIFASAYLLVALYANRRYPIWLVSFQLVSVLSHLVRGEAAGVGSVAYQIMVIAPSYLMMAFLAGGLIAHRVRLARHGPYRPWRTSSPRSPGPMPKLRLPD